MPDRVTFDHEYPAVLQDDQWSCLPTSLTWAMRALGRHPADGWIENDMLALQLVTREQGLLDHTGAGVVTWLQLGDVLHYGSDYYGVSNSQCPIGWDALVPEIDPHPPYPILLGLPNWSLDGGGHWSGVRGYDARRGVVLLANPATGPLYGLPFLTHAEFEARAAGRASIVRILHPDLLSAPVDVPPPPPPPPPPVDPKAGLRARVAAIDAEWGRLKQELLGG